MRIYISLSLLLIVSGIYAQQNNQMQFLPANDSYIAGINKYSNDTGTFSQYFVKDAQWVLNENIPSFTPIFKPEHQRLQYISPTEGTTPNLFVYSNQTGDFVFYYLKNNEWQINEYLPKGKMNFKSNNIEMEFSPSNEAKSPYIFAYTTDGKELKILEVTDGNWNQIDYFPTSVPHNY